MSTKLVPLDKQYLACEVAFAPHEDYGKSNGAEDRSGDGFVNRGINFIRQLQKSAR